MTGSGSNACRDFTDSRQTTLSRGSWMYRDSCYDYYSNFATDLPTHRLFVFERHSAENLLLSPCITTTCGVQNGNLFPKKGYVQLAYKAGIGGAGCLDLHQRRQGRSLAPI